MKKIIFLFLISSLMNGCQSEKEDFDQKYFNAYWLSKHESEDWRYPNINHFQDSTVNLFLVHIGYIPNLRFRIFPLDSVGFSWNFGEEDEFFTKSKFTIISRDTFLFSSEKGNYTDSLFRISKEEAEKIMEEWEGEIEIEPYRTK